MAQAHGQPGAARQPGRPQAYRADQEDQRRASPEEGLTLLRPADGDQRGADEPQQQAVEPLDHGLAQPPHGGAQGAADPVLDALDRVPERAGGAADLPGPAYRRADDGRPESADGERGE